MGQPDKVTIPARGELNRENECLFLFAPENLPSRNEFVRPVPRQSAHLPKLRLNLVLTHGFLLSPAAASVYLFKRISIIMAHVTQPRRWR